MVFLRNTWYAAAWSADVAPGTLLGRTICEEPVVVGRTESGVLTALYDRCPHRFAALSSGKVVDEHIECVYHGLRFDVSGACVHNPHGNKKIPPAATCRRFPVIEKHSIVWIWMGDAEPQPAEIPDFSILDVAAPDSVTKRDYIMMNAGYELITNNLLDLSHVNSLHDGLLGNAAANDAEITVESDGSTVTARRFAKNVPVPKFMDLIFRQDGRNVDFWNEIRWNAPACMLLYAGVTEPETGKAAGTGFRGIHLLTPETEYTTHYMFTAVRDNPPLRSPEEEVAIRDEISRLRRFIFETQDEPMIATQQKRIRQAPDTPRPALLSIDAGPVRALRILHDRITQEQTSPKEPLLLN